MKFFVLAVLLSFCSCVFSSVENLESQEDFEKRDVLTCAVCKRFWFEMRQRIQAQGVNEGIIVAQVKNACDSLFLTPYCQRYIYPYFHEVFRTLRDNRTDSIACNRLNLCVSKIVSVTGNVMFAQGDVLNGITDIGDNQISIERWFSIEHPSMLTAAISGFACSPEYCAVLLKSTTNPTQYGTTALSLKSQIHHLLDNEGPWYGPWFDAGTDEFWMAHGTPRNLTFGVFDCIDGVFYPHVYLHLYIPQQYGSILSGSVLNRILYFTILDDNHVFKLDLALHYLHGNISLPHKNTMLNHNPVTQVLYGYSPGPEGVFRFDNPDSPDPNARTKLANIDFSGIGLTPSSTINPIDNTMWISLWNVPNRAWMKINLNLTEGNVQWTPVGEVEGFFDFNPFTMERADS